MHDSLFLCVDADPVPVAGQLTTASWTAQVVAAGVNWQHELVRTLAS